MSTCFQPERKPDVAPSVGAAFDAAILAREAKQRPRTYLGASRWGVECARALAYEWHQTPKDEGRGFPAGLLRVFDMGHDAEDRVAAYLIAAGFKLETRACHGGQFEFLAAYNFEREQHDLGGHYDGIINAVPEGVECPFSKFPLIWENKGLNDNQFGKVEKQGVKKAKPIYYVQMQAYMAYARLEGALFTAINRNDGRIYAEWVHFDRQTAQEASDKAVRVVKTTEPEEMPRISDDPSFYLCRFCDFAGRCHKKEE